jgi:hypothetical protein
MITFSLKVNLLPSIMAKNVDNVMIPNPPICIRNNITIWPNIEKSFPTSFTTRPVTHVALVAVKKASIGLNECPGLELWGSDNKNPPMIITRRKLTATN